MSKQCQACGHPFTPRSQNPNQNYCTNSECQREHRRRWQQQKRRDDADYRDNDAPASRHGPPRIQNIGNGTATRIPPTPNAIEIYSSSGIKTSGRR